MPQDDELIGVEAVNDAAQQVLAEFERRSATDTDQSAPQQETADSGEGEAASPSPEPSPESASPWMGLSEDDIKIAYQVYSWARGLTPEQVQAIDAALSARPQPPQQTLPPPAPEQRIDDEELDPEIRDLKNEVAQMRQVVSQQQYEQQYVQMQTTIEQTTATFAQKHELSDDEVEEVAAALAQSGMFPALSQQFGPVEGLNRGLDFYYRQSPKFAEREQERIKQEALQTAAKLEEKARKASSVSAAPGSVNKPEPAPTMQGRKKRANVQAVAQFISENT